MGLSEIIPADDPLRLITARSYHMLTQPFHALGHITN